MQTCPEREVVVEIEHIKTVRKRASTRLRLCRGCGKSSDFIAIARAAALFELEPERVLDFVRVNSCHVIIGNEGEIHICLADLLSAMSKRIKKGSVKLLGEL